MPTLAPEPVIASQAAAEASVRRKPRYRADIDGLRALAILPVLLYHADVRGFSGGFVGVDVFFVISGYLITYLIVHEMAAGEFRFSGFWLRRARRILPAAVVVIAATLVAGWFILLPFDLRRTGQSAVAQAAFVANVYFWQKTGYFFDPAETMPLLHTWSLAVEEQFYFLMPATLFLLSRHLLRYRILLLAVLLVTSFGYSVWAVERAPEAAFYFLQYRAWELLLGCVTALLVFDRPGAARQGRWWNELSSGLGALAIAGSVVLYDRNTPFPGWAAVGPCLGTAAIIWANRQDLTAVGKMLAWAPFVWIGLISYSLYLWHWPLLVYARYAALEPLPRATVFGLLSAAVLLSWATYRWVEMPIRRRSVLVRPRHFAGTAALAVLVVAAAGLVLHLAGGFPARLPSHIQQAYEEAHRSGMECADVQVSYMLYACGATGADSVPDLIVWGDSHATKTMPVIDVLARRWNLNVWKYSCWPLLDVYSVLESRSVAAAPCTAPNEALIAFIKQRGVKHVILIAYWSQYTEGRDILVEGPGKRDPFFADVGTRSSSVTEARAVFRRHFIDTVHTLRGIGVNVWIMKEVPAHRYVVPNQLTRTLLFGGDPEALGRSFAELATRYAFIDATFEEVADVARVIDPAPAFCRNGFCRAAEDGRALYSDYHHVSLYGAMRLQPILEPAFIASAESRRATTLAGQ